MTGARRPWHATYWVTDGTVLAGDYPGSDEQIAALAAAAIRLVVDLTEPGSLPAYADRFADVWGTLRLVDADRTFAGGAPLG